jgi:hypothetical protein
MLVRQVEGSLKSAYRSRSGFRSVSRRIAGRAIAYCSGHSVPKGDPRSQRVFSGSSSFCRALLVVTTQVGNQFHGDVPKPESDPERALIRCGQAVFERLQWLNVARN